jgi:hypothetical protein
VKKMYQERVKNRPKKATAVTGHAIYVEYTLTLPGRVELVARHLAVLNTAFEKLFADENFLTLLRAESMTTVPACLRPFLEGKRCGYEND